MFRNYKFNNFLKKACTLVLGVALLMGATPISVYATSIVPIGSDLISQATEFGIGDFIFGALRTGLSFDFSSYSDTWEDFLNDWKEDGFVKASIDKWVDNLQNIETENVINKVEPLSSHNFDRIKQTLSSVGQADIPQLPIVLSDFEKECLKGAYNLYNQSLYNITDHSDSRYSGTPRSLYDSLSRASFGTYVSGRKFIADLSGYSDVKYLINPYDNYNITLFVNGINYNYQNLYTVLTSNNNGSFGLMLESINTDNYLHVSQNWIYRGPYQGKFYDTYLNHNFTSLAQSLLYLWGSKDIPIFYGRSLDDCVLLVNPIVSGYSFSGGYELSVSDPQPLVVNYPPDSQIDMNALITAIKSAISNKTIMDLSDIEDLIVDVNGQRAFATYEIYRNDYDVLSQELFAPYELVFSPDPEYIEAYGSGLETAGNIINNSVSVIPDDISLFLFGGAFVLLIILVLRRGSE